MAHITFNKEKEMAPGPLYPQEGIWFNCPYAPVEKLNPPITPEENLIRYYKKEEFEWYPDIMSDCIDLTPTCIPDVVACGYSGGRDSFGVKWIPVESNAMLPALVEPGFKLLEDIADWKSLKWPDVESWDWETEAQKYRTTYQNDDRHKRGVLLIGYFERLISLMTFEEAAIAMISDPESVSDFFSKLTDFNIRIMDHYIDDFGCGSILIHDDWSSQKAPFFSLDTVMDVLVPHLKRFCDHAHERGVFVTLHSCGNGTMLIPAIKAAGFDGWQAQENAIHMPEVLTLCGDDLILETYPAVPDQIEGKELLQFIEDKLKYCPDYRSLITFYEFNFERIHETRRYVYELSRKMALQKTGETLL